jgi:hypothetical protein
MPPAACGPPDAPTPDEGGADASSCDRRSSTTLASGLADRAHLHLQTRPLPSAAPRATSISRPCVCGLLMRSKRRPAPIVQAHFLHRRGRLAKEDVMYALSRADLRHRMSCILASIGRRVSLSTPSVVAPGRCGRSTQRRARGLSSSHSPTDEPWRVLHASTLASPSGWKEPPALGASSVPPPPCSLARSGGESACSSPTWPSTEVPSPGSWVHWLIRLRKRSRDFHRDPESRPTAYARLFLGAKRSSILRLVSLSLSCPCAACCLRWLLPA